LKLDFYRDLHKLEFDRREAMTNRSSAVVAGLTTLGGLIGFLVVGFKPPGGVPDYLFWSLLIAAGIAVITAAAFLIASYTAPPLLDVDRPTVWRQYLVDLTEEYKLAAGSFPSAEAEFEDHLMSTLAAATDKNIATNTIRGYRLVKSNLAMLAAFVLVVFAAVIYYYANAVQRPSTDIQKVMQMLATQYSLVCIPTERSVEAATKPGTRPVPSPVPKPGQKLDR
jgi:hypothetical protein